MLYSLDVCSHVKEVEEATAVSAASHHSSESKGDEQLVRQLRKLVEQLREESLATSREIAELRQEKENERQELGRRMGALQQQHENEREELGSQIEALQQQKENEREKLERRIGSLQQQHENGRGELGRQIEALQQNEFLAKELRLKQLQREHAIVEAVDTERLLEETDDGEVQLLLFLIDLERYFRNRFSTVLVQTRVLVLSGL